MPKKADIRSYCNPSPRLTKDAQLTKMTGEPYIETRKGDVFDKLVLSLRKGSIVEVVEVGCLAPLAAPRTGTPAKRKKIMVERIKRIQKEGGIIHEINSGYWSNKGEIPDMVARGIDYIATSGRAEARHKRGSPIELTVEQHHEALLIWRSREHKNDEQRLDAIEKAIGRRLGHTWCWNNFGPPSGRKSNV